tara:strand:- start:105 stop:560 length:456 start_codon:yes stop_codon:yes gene_type:complete
MVNRWPEWEPTDQDRRDWKKMATNWSWEMLDDAMLKVRMNYSSKIPQMKWVREAYYSLLDEERQAKRRQRDQQEAQGLSHVDHQAQLDKQNCMSRLEALPKEDLLAAIASAEKTLGYILQTPIPHNPAHMSWMQRFAVLCTKDGLDDGVIR